jgi:hypothetical protein
MLKTCPLCRVEFLTRAATYCSRACGIKAHYDNIGRKISKHYQGICVMCKEPYQRTFWSPHGETCGRTCAARLRVVHRTHPWKDGQHPPNWKGIVQKGLRQYVPKGHPYRDQKGYVAQHRLVMEQHIGRYLEPFEKVHHRNGVKTDNRIDNLEIVTHARPNGVVICPHCRKSFQVH